ncbi:hypothetical protein M8C21_002110 [Ambrosia artemisiifolia]|uniref:Uncharacterized protein n=1 Tax=Ambrosia artemisiifolia TaxID=4212 RepID=A0AAD5GS81_AMBAR|nr:hypothetical protein M8C21_002110 [Ambrosia artemisiifolia]
MVGQPTVTIKPSRSDDTSQSPLRFYSAKTSPQTQP